MKLNLFKKLENLEEEKLHPKFKYLRDEVLLRNEKNILSEWTDGFIDRDNKIIKEFQTTFHSSFWEFYLFAVLKKYGFEINQNHDRPDFMISKPVEFNIEAVVANIKQKGKKENERTFENTISMLEPPHRQNNFNQFLDEAITRYANAIQAKNKLYKKNYSNCEWVKKHDPFLVALSSYDQIDYGREFIYPMMALLYGWYYRPETKGYYKKEYITKPDSSAQIPIGLFESKEYENISAIVFSCTMTLGKLTALSIVEENSSYNYNKVFTIRHDNDDQEIPYKMQIVSKETPEYLDDGLFIFHNPNAKNKLPEEIFKNTNILQVRIIENCIYFDGGNLPVVSRFNLPKMFLPEKYIKEFVVETMLKYNGF